MPEDYDQDWEEGLNANYKPVKGERLKGKTVTVGGLKFSLRSRPKKTDVVLLKITVLDGYILFDEMESDEAAKTLFSLMTTGKMK